MPMKFVAVTGPSVLGGGTFPAVRNRLAAGVPGYQVIPTFGSIGDLLAQVNAALTANLDCLDTLEILGHGGPHNSDGITKRNAAAFGTGLRALNLCDEVRIYLSGCNTGVTDRSQPIAQVVSQHTPTEAADNVRVTVYGTVGYLLQAGSNAEGTARTRSGNPPWTLPFPDSGDGINPGVYLGSRDAIGDACYRKFREGQRV